MKKTAKKKNLSKTVGSKVKHAIEEVDIKKVASEVGGHLKGLKTKYEAMDGKTKKKLIAALGTATALLVTAHTVKKTVKKIEKNRKK